eukprot:TRINITY_DN115_c0_g1_i5.p1 TRINITY_DN115_c0_g1~~TRINITY_DN115_c0_g1_i5.p1  ORF type:complete len:193 (-),score=67.58 TRINITY_DN115_c0_g1_i5:22-600(-)
MKNMKNVLISLGYLTYEEVITQRGRVAAEINTADELLVTELIFRNAFDKLDVPQCVAMLSCLTEPEKSEKTVKLKEELNNPLRILQEAARHIAQVSIEKKIQLDVEEYVNKFKPTLMDVVHSWCNKAKFIDICKMTDIFEGSIIRALRRLEELLRQCCSAAKAMGNTELEKKFAEGITLIKRDIVFAASLYL